MQISNERLHKSGDTLFDAEFSKEDLVYLCKAYFDITGKKIYVSKLDPKKINMIVNILLKDAIKNKWIPDITFIQKTKLFFGRIFSIFIKKKSINH